MKRLTTTFLSLMAAVAVMAQGVAFEPEGTTLEQAAAKAKAEHKLIFLDAFTQWCGPCKKMARDVFPQEQVGSYMNPKFINLQIDMESDYGAPLAKQLQIQAYPTFVIFNADAKEIGRFLGGSSAEDFIKKVEEKSQDNTSAALEERWNSGDRDPQFLQDYLKTLTSSYKAQDADLVAEAILAGHEKTYASDSTLRTIFLRNINNPFATVFIHTAKHPEALAEAIGSQTVNMKIQNVLTNYQRQLIVEHDGTATLDQEKFDNYVALLGELGIPDADHYRLTTLITLADKQKDYDNYLKYIKEYLNNKTLDANDMQLARWTKPFAEATASDKQKKEMKKILQQRLDEIKSGKRQAATSVGNMHLSRPTDELLQLLIDALDGKMPQ